VPNDKSSGIGAPETQTAPLLEEKRESISVLFRAVAKAARSDIALDDPSRRAFIAALVFSSSIL
jgi:uncharacterized membrane protein YebE (DUF533 family)